MLKKGPTLVWRGRKNKKKERNRAIFELIRRTFWDLDLDLEAR